MISPQIFVALSSTSKLDLDFQLLSDLCFFCWNKFKMYVDINVIIIIIRGLFISNRFNKNKSEQEQYKNGVELF